MQEVLPADRSQFPRAEEAGQRDVAQHGRDEPGVVVGLGIWWRKLGPAGTNVNELTHQRLTDIGRAPAFYDCLVQVAALSTQEPV